MDQNGEFWHIIIGAVIGGIINTATHWDKIDNFWDGVAAFGIGAAAGAVGAATGGAAFAAAGGAAGGAGGFLAGFAGGSVGAAYSMPILSTGNSAYFGDPMMTPGQYAAGILTGGLLGGTINGGIALLKGNPFLTGTPKPALSNWQSPALSVDRSDVKLNLDGMRPEIKSISMPDDGIYYFDNAKSALKYSDDIVTEIVRDPNFRSNLISTSGINPGTATHAHHVFPLEYALKFQNAGINSNSYGAWWAPGHLSNASQYNQAWGAFFRANPGAAQAEIFREAIRLKYFFGY